MQNQNQAVEIKKHFNDLSEKWKSSIVAREQISIFSGGAISPGRMANLDCLGEGPKDRLRIGRKVCYPVKSLVQWLIERSIALPQKLSNN